MAENRRNFVIWAITYPSGLLARIGNRPAAFLTRTEARRHVREVPYGAVTKFEPSAPAPSTSSPTDFPAMSRREELRQAKREGRIAAYEQLARWALTGMGRCSRRSLDDPAEMARFALYGHMADRATALAYKASRLT